MLSSTSRKEGAWGGILDPQGDSKETGIILQR